MRAGSLSDARIVALLQKYFVCARMPELSTRELIRDPADVALLERLHREASSTEYPFRPGFFGGEREAFFTADGDVVEVFLSLGTQGQPDSQFQAEQRAQPEAKVQRFFAKAARALTAVHGDVPEDFAALRDGTAPEIAAVRAAPIPLPSGACDSEPALRVSVRNDRAMYTELCGTALVTPTAQELAAVLPDLAAGAREQEWPRALFLQLAHASYPRGEVLPRLDDESIHGTLRTVVDEVTATTARGRFAGSLALLPTKREELGARKEARMQFSLRTELVGDFLFDRASGRFTSLRLASANSELTHVWGGRNVDDERYWLGIELLHRPE